MSRDAPPGRELRIARTAELDTAALAAARSLLDDVFGAEMTDEAWEHALGGVHALVWEGGLLVGHGSVVQRGLAHGGRLLRAGYVEGVGVRFDWRGRGHGAAIMDALERVVRVCYDLGALGASEAGASFYAHRGWMPWQGRTWARAPSGRTRTAEEDQDVYVLDFDGLLDRSGDLTCDWRAGDVW